MIIIKKKILDWLSVREKRSLIVGFPLAVRISRDKLALDK